MPNYTEPEKSDVTYNEPSAEGWFSGGWFNKGWFSGSSKGSPSYTEPEKSTPNYNEPSKGD